MLIAQMWHPQDSLDAVMQVHVAYVFNQCLQTVRKEGATKEAVEHCGMMVLRLYTVWKAYKAKKQSGEAREWIAKLLEIVEEAKKL